MNTTTVPVLTLLQIGYRVAHKPCIHLGFHSTVNPIGYDLFSCISKEAWFFNDCMERTTMKEMLEGMIIWHVSNFHILFIWIRKKI